MDIRIKATNYEMTPEVAAYLDERVTSIEKILGAEASAARCEIEIGKAAGNQRHSEHMWKAEFLVTYPGGPVARATNHAVSVNAAIDDAKEELVRQLRREKGLHRSFIRKTGSAIKRFMRFGTGE